MKKLPVKLHFVCPQELIWPELLDGNARDLDQGIIAQRSISGLDCWIIRTFCELRTTSSDVSIGPKTKTDAINITEPNSFGRKSRLTLDYVVSAVHDQCPSGLANYHIVQNTIHRVAARPVISLPHWPQSGINPRDRGRGARIERVSFKGYWINLDEGFRSQAFKDQLGSIGIVLDLGPEDVKASGMTWADYSTSDAVLGVRNLTVYDSMNKPASKLVNAWWGEAVALLGPEPAFQELRRSSLDYFEVFGPQDAFKALRKLQEEPQLYLAMIEQGISRRRMFSAESVRAAWLETVENTLYPSYLAWKKKSALEKTALVAKMHVGENKVRTQHYDLVRHGPRILDIREVES